MKINPLMLVILAGTLLTGGAISRAASGADQQLLFTSFRGDGDSAPPAWGDSQWGGQRDGTFRNPVLPADYSDLDCIRVGPDYYAISSTFQYSPGVVILHSLDLVNWSILGHVADDLTQIGPELNWDRMRRYGRGVWAGAIRYHDDKFWVYFGTPDEGYFMSTARNPAGPWEPLHCVMAESGWDDCCPFWDDDGQGYFLGTHFKDGYKTWLFKLTPDGRNLVGGWLVLLNEGSGREATTLYKINGNFDQRHNLCPGKNVVRLVRHSGAMVIPSVASSES